MKRSPVTKVMKAKALTNPTPEFVSQVIAGANQEPHRVVKMDGVDEIAALFATKELTMKDAVKTAKAAGHDIAQLVFKGGQFTDRAKVDAWLKEGGFEGYEVTEVAAKSEEDHPEFTVVSTTLKFETGSIKKIKGQADGLHVFVGKVEGEVVVEKTAEEIAAEAAAVKGSTVALKADEPKVEDAPAAEAAPAVEAEVADVEAAKVDTPAATVAPVTVEAATALIDTFRADLTAKGVPTMARKGTYTVSEIGYVLDSMRWLMNEADYNGLSDTAVASIKQSAANMVNVLIEAMQGTIDSFVEAFKGDTQKTEAVTATKSEAADAVANATAEAPAPAAPVADPALAEVLKGIGEAISTLTQTVKAQGEALEEVKTTAAKAEEVRLEQGQSRKGADVTEPTAPAVTTKSAHDVEQEHAQRRLRSAFGSYKGNGYDNN